MSDWADEIAEQVVRPTVKTIGDREALVAAALRKARADGLRAAVAKISEIPADGASFGDLATLTAELWSLVVRTEKGEA